MAQVVAKKNEEQRAVEAAFKKNAQPREADPVSAGSAAVAGVASAGAVDEKTASEVGALSAPVATPADVVAHEGGWDLSESLPVVVSADGHVRCVTDTEVQHAHVPSKPDTDQALVRKLLDVEEGMSDWEVGFVESVASRVLDEKRDLSPPQRGVCNKILEKLGL